MIVRCTQCDAAYAVEDRKIANKKFGFSCPKCGTSVIIDNRKIAKPLNLDLESIPEYRPADDDQAVPGGSLSKEEFDFQDEEALSRAVEDFDPGEKPKRASGKTAPADELDLGDIEERITGGRAEKGKGGDESFTDEEPLKIDDFESGLGQGGSEELKPLEDEINFDEIIRDDSVPAAGTSARAKMPQREARGKSQGIGDDLLLQGDVQTDEIFSKGSADVDESITIDLDSLDIELEEAEGKKTGVSPESEDLDDLAVVMETGDLPDIPRKEDDDFNTTIDLDTLDITLDEVEELKRGVPMDEDERLSLEDTGLTMEDLGEEGPGTGDRDAFVEEGLEEEDIKLNLKEIDPTLSVDNISERAEAADSMMLEDMEVEKLPEIDLDKFQTEEAFEEAVGTSAAQPLKDFLDIETREDLVRYHEEAEKGGGDVVPGGAINFSIDYSLSYSRLGALLRLIGLFGVGLFPHFIVLMLYSALSGVLGFFNWIIALFTGYTDEDFTEIQEKTLRYAVSIAACASDVVEEMPAFAGRKDIDYPLQLTVIYPIRYSRILALLRISVIGIYIIMLPHLLLLTLLTMGAWLIGLIGIMSILATKRWPNILFDFMVRYYNYISSVFAFISGIVDKYPSFRFE